MFSTLQRIIFFTVLFSTACSNVSDSTKKYFNYNQSGGIGSLDPAFAGNQANIRATTQLFNGLVAFDNALNIVPELAESWDIDSSKMIYTFSLRKDIYFHDHPLFENGKGRLMDADDVIFSFNRIIDTTGIFNKGLWIFKDKLLKNKGLISDTCFKKIDQHTVRIYLDHPVPNFLQILAMPYAYIVPKDIAAHYGIEFRSNPVGTGAFKFKFWDENNALILEKNQNYWKKDSLGQQLPYLDGIKVSFVFDKTQAFRLFLLKELDFYSGFEEDIVDEIFYRNGDIRETFGKEYQVQKSPYLNTEYLCIQLDKNATCYRNDPDHPLLSKDFRKALAFALDRKRMVMHLRNGIGVAGENGIVPTATPNYKSELVKGYTFQPDSAVYYLNKSGVTVKNASKIAITVAPEHKALSEFLVKQWEEVLGISVGISLLDAKVYRSMSNEGAISFFRASWLGDYPDPENYIALYLSKNQSPNGPNKSRYNNDELDQLFEKASNFEEEKRFEMYRQIDQAALEDVPFIVLYYDEVVRLLQNNISGVAPNAMDLLLLEKAKKKD